MPDPMTSEQVLLTAVAKGFTTANWNPTASGSGVVSNQMAQQAWVTLESNDARYHLCGLTPAANCGHIWTNGATLVLTGLDSIRKFKAINTSGGSSTMVATFFF